MSICIHLYNSSKDQKVIRVKWEAQVAKVGIKKNKKTKKQEGEPSGRDGVLKIGDKRVEG